MINQLCLQSAFCKMDDGVNGDVKTLWTGCLMRVKSFKDQFNASSVLEIKKVCSNTQSKKQHIKFNFNKFDAAS